jgi:hypothetical protein
MLFYPLNNPMATKQKMDSGDFSPESQNVTPEGFEPPTLWSEARYSIQLSYGANNRWQKYEFSLLPFKIMQYKATFFVSISLLI